MICDIPSFLPPDTRKTPSRAASTGAPRVVIAPTRVENGFFRFHANPADVSYPRRPTQSTGPEVPQVRSGQENHVVRVPHRFPRVAFLPHRTRAWPPTQHNTHALDSTIVSVTSFSRSADVFFSVFFFANAPPHRRPSSLHIHRPLNPYQSLSIPTTPEQTKTASANPRTTSLASRPRNPKRKARLGRMGRRKGAGRERTCRTRTNRKARRVRFIFAACLESRTGHRLARPSPLPPVSNRDRHVPVRIAYTRLCVSYFS